MNKLFHKFQSRQFQFALELMARLAAQQEVPNNLLYDMAVQYGLEHADKCITPLIACGILKKTRSGVCMAENITPPQVPLSTLEEEYLQYILQLPASSLFLPQSVQSTLSNPQILPMMNQIQYYQVLERASAPNMDATTFQQLLSAIRERRWIHYTFCSKDNSKPCPASAVPWKLEHSAYDGRWWAILYLPNEQRMVKSWLPNLQNIKLGGYSNVADEQIETAMQQLLVDEAVVIRITPEKNALDRCARVFERQMFQQIHRELDGQYTLTFRYYKFDRNEILRKLLYLGSAVELLAPLELRNDLLQLINQALTQ